MATSGIFVRLDFNIEMKKPQSPARAAGAGFFKKIKFPHKLFLDFFALFI
jgi:hypothetical protein